MSCDSSNRTGAALPVKGFNGDRGCPLCWGGGGGYESLPPTSHPLSLTAKLRLPDSEDTQGGNDEGAVGTVAQEEPGEEGNNLNRFPESHCRREKRVQRGKMVSLRCKPTHCRRRDSLQTLSRRQCALGRGSRARTTSTRRPRAGAERGAAPLSHSVGSLRGAQDRRPLCYFFGVLAARASLPPAMSCE